MDSEVDRVAKVALKVRGALLQYIFTQVEVNE